MDRTPESSPRTTEVGYETPGRTASASTSRDREPARESMVTERVEIKKAENGGYIAICYKKPAGKRQSLDSYTPPKEYAFSSLGEAVAFLEGEFGGAGATGADAAMPSARRGAAEAMGAPTPPAQPSRPMNTSAYLTS